MAVVQDRDKLCHACSQIPPIESFGTEFQTIWASFAEIENGAHSGCPSCSFFYSTASGSERDQDSPAQPAVQYPYGLRWNSFVPPAPTAPNERPTLELLCEARLPPAIAEGSFDFAFYDVFAKAEEPLAKILKIHDVDPDPRSDRVFSGIRRWIETCRRTHAACQSRDDPVLPRFIVEIRSGSGPALAPRLRLVETDGSTKAPYITLSFVWGVQVQPVQLSKANFGQFKKSIDYTLLPQTIQDAIYVARRLDVGYIWIDTLCIVQDDSEIKKQQIAQMNTIFGHSYLTVQAGNVHSVHESFLRPRPPPEKTPLQLRYNDASDVFLRANSLQQPFKDSPANRRGWVFEESVLPTRLLVYGTHQTAFACRTVCELEDGFRGQLRNVPYPSLLHPPRWWIGEPEHFAARPPDRRLDFLRCWYRALDWSYTRRLFTLSHDKLPAISGMATRLQSEIGGRYLAGLWESDMPWSLLWQSRDHQGKPAWIKEPQHLTRPAATRAPSWSWASVDGPTDHAFMERFRHPDGPLATAYTESLSADPLGVLSDGGVLRISSALIYATVIPPTHPEFQCLGPIASRKHLVHRTILSLLVWARPSTGAGAGAGAGAHEASLLGLANFDIKAEQGAGVWCLLISHAKGLLLECVDPGKKIFARVGYFSLSVDDWLPSLNQELRVEVTIL
ncbi:HET domain-containing protein [Aspergillus clavatus NRRL 1]|uniref:HET domain protein n=1 Tax=Aspergillus clavatus (strain ATCC 1007 / CBS 513.65 / DSM 816 / NCTC 3887 / NRRL 1 / QM 1276 / 107) TaxID=344612 RepID=A1CED4_ASPCL|nr:HET domain protein [Aspergillus clavatus NRRL 1]EAW11233.1 HET domain protein [Aspergillus clavatus NRRL 1]